VRCRTLLYHDSSRKEVVLQVDVDKLVRSFRFVSSRHGWCWWWVVGWSVGWSVEYSRESGCSLDVILGRVMDSFAADFCFVCFMACDVIENLTWLAKAESPSLKIKADRRERERLSKSNGVLVR
jgi:hypothetical protein